MGYYLINIFRLVVDHAGVGAGIGVLVLFYFGRKMLDSRSEERQSLVTELSTTRQQLFTLTTNHMTHLTESQDAFMKFQTEVVKIQEGIAGSLRELADSQKKTHDEMHLRFNRMFEDHGDIKERIARIEGSQGKQGN